MLTFTTLAAVNAERAARWHRNKPWSLSDWGLATCGELGEACNVIKKLNRVRDGIPSAHDPDAVTLTTQLAQEIADTLIYLDLLASAAGIDLEHAVRKTFNAVSEREGFPERL